MNTLANQMADESTPHTDMRMNGASWFWFGQAVIDSAQSATCSFWYGEGHEEFGEEIVVVKREDLARIKAFAQKKFFKKFDFSPTVPDGRAIRWGNDITFYSIRVKPDDELPIYDKVLVYIPISNQTTGDQYDDIVREYHELIKSITTAQKEKSAMKWWLLFGVTDRTLTFFLAVCPAT